MQKNAISVIHMRNLTYRNSEGVLRAFSLFSKYTSIHPHISYQHTPSVTHSTAAYYNERVRGGNGRNRVGEGAAGTMRSSSSRADIMSFSTEQAYIVNYRRLPTDG